MDQHYKDLKKEARLIGICLNLSEGGKKVLATGQGCLNYDNLSEVSKDLRSGVALVRLVPLIEEPEALDTWAMLYLGCHTNLFKDKDEDTGEEKYYVEFNFHEEGRRYLETYEDVHRALCCGKVDKLLGRDHI